LLIRRLHRGPCSHGASLADGQISTKPYIAAAGPPSRTYRGRTMPIILLAKIRPPGRFET
ncbi:hypothetical protein V2J23_18415, partial [Geobacillus thermoleovorans]|uniref:hypothetical protein n=1 Tax=Geobacillus thermoleovorans TaxID=33941 RepID=UPI00345B906D